MKNKNRRASKINESSDNRNAVGRDKRKIRKKPCEIDGKNPIEPAFDALG